MECLATGDGDGEGADDALAGAEVPLLLGGVVLVLGVCDTPLTFTVGGGVSVEVASGSFGFGVGGGIGSACLLVGGRGSPSMFEGGVIFDRWV